MEHSIINQGKVQGRIIPACRYCGHSLRFGETMDNQLPSCSPIVRTGWVCDWCGEVALGFQNLHETVIQELRGINIAL